MWVPGNRVTPLFNEVLGVEVRVPESPKRVVSFSPAATETLFMIGLGPRVAGVSAFCARPAEAKSKRRLGSYNTVRDEVLEAINPDLVLTVTGYQREFAVRLSKKFPVYPLELPATVPGIVDFVTKVGLVVGEPESGRALGNDLLRKLGKLKPGKALSGYVEIDLGGPVTFGAYSYITDAFRYLGCNNVFGEARSEWLAPDLNDIARLDPDLIVYEPKMFSTFREGDLERLSRARNWSGMRAVKSGNVFLTPGPLDFLAHHGPAFISDVMPWLAQRFVEAGENIVA